MFCFVILPEPHMHGRGTHLCHSHKSGPASGNEVVSCGIGFSMRKEERKQRLHDSRGYMKAMVTWYLFFGILNFDQGLGVSSRHCLPAADAKVKVNSRQVASVPRQGWSRTACGPSWKNLTFGRKSGWSRTACGPSWKKIIWHLQENLAQQKCRLSRKDIWTTKNRVTFRKCNIVKDLHSTG